MRQAVPSMKIRSADVTAGDDDALWLPSLGRNVFVGSDTAA
jgi:hypothetical protein